MFEFGFIKKIKARCRLRKIEKAIGLTMSPEQRRIVLDPEFPQRLMVLGRRTGKTVTALVWALMWRTQTISRSSELNKAGWRGGPEMHSYETRYAIPDPDISDVKRMDHVLKTYASFYRLCSKAGIDVAKIGK